MKASAAQGTVLLFVLVITVGVRSSGTTDCPNEPNWPNNGVQHYFCNIERISQLTLHWILKSQSISSTIATCYTEKPGPCINSGPCFQATMHPDGVSEIRMASYFYNSGDVECHGARDSNDLCTFTLSSRNDQEVPSFLSPRTVCNAQVPVSTTVPIVDRTFIQIMLKSTTKVVSDQHAPSLPHTNPSVNSVSISAARINLDPTSVQSMRDEYTRKDLEEATSSSTSNLFLTKPPSTKWQITSHSTNQEGVQDPVSTTMSPLNITVSYRQKTSGSHTSTNVNQIILNASFINVDRASVRITKDVATDRVSTTKATTTSNVDLQSIAIGATAAFVVTVCVTGMILISLYRRSRKSCTHTNILKEGRDKTAKYFGERDSWGGISPTSTSTCVCLSEIDFPTSLATDSSCSTSKKLTTDLVDEEMFNPVYSSGSLVSEMHSEAGQSNP